MKRKLIASVNIITILATVDVSAQIPDPEEGKTLVVFYRKKSMKGGAIKFSVKETDKNYGQLTNGSVIHINVDPGEHTFF